MTIRYGWQWIWENWGRESGEQARQHTEESGHNDQFLLSGASTLTCGNPDCDPQWRNHDAS